MSKRAASSSEDNNDDDTRKNNKHRRMEEADEPPVSEDSRSLVDLKDDCLVNALSYLTYEDMNSFAMTSRRCRDIRSHESLDQTRTRTIIISEEHKSILSVIDSMKEKRWDRVFSARNKTHLRIIGLEKLTERPTMEEIRANIRGAPFRFQGVVSLDFSYDSHASSKRVLFQSIYVLTSILSNLKEAVMSNVESQPLIDGDSLTRLTWNGSATFLNLDGIQLRLLYSLTDLYVDGCLLGVHDRNSSQYMAEPGCCCFSKQ